MSGHPQRRLEAPSSSERVDISQRPPPSPHNHPRLLGSWSSPGFLITGQRKHLAFLSWSAESGGGFLLPWALSPARDCPPPPGGAAVSGLAWVLGSVNMCGYTHLCVCAHMHTVCSPAHLRAHTHHPSVGRGSPVLKDAA